jgi:hypothetical protein
LILGWDRLHAWVRADASSIGSLRLLSADASRLFFSMLKPAV